MYGKALQKDVFLHRVFNGEHGGDVSLKGLGKKGGILFYQETLFIGEYERDVKEGSGKGQLSP